MKKLIAIILVFALSLVLGSVAFAAVQSAPSIQSDSTKKPYVVLFKATTANATIDQIGSRIRMQDGRVKKRFTQIPAISVDMTSADAATLVKDPSVQAVEPDIVIKAFDAELVNSWGVDQIEADLTWPGGIMGTGVKVGIIDTGISSHSDLNIAGGVSFVSYTTSTADDNGHGTHVAGTVGARDNDVGAVGAAPNASLYAIKVLDQAGSGYLTSIISGIEWAITNQMDIINMSLGTSTYSASLEAAVNKAYAANILVVAAAGNSGTTNTTDDNVAYPARFAAAIAVAATDRNKTRASFSSTGPAVEVAAPGVSIYSTSTNNNYAILSGTSMAAPHVTGTLALLKQKYPSYTAAQLRDELNRMADELGAAGRDPVYGYGLVDANLIGSIPMNPTIAVNSITVSGLNNATTVKLNKTLQMFAAVLPSEATNKSVTWSVTSNTGRATINATTGVLKGTKVGTVTVKAQATDGSGVLGTTVITVVR